MEINVTDSGLCHGKVDGGPAADKLNVYGVRIHENAHETFSVTTIDPATIESNKKGYVCEEDGKRTILSI